MPSTVSKTQSKGLKGETKKYRQGTKRSRRLAEDSTGSFEDEAKKVNELVTYLRGVRGWMEFHPSSRHGSGTAVYGYIPSSIASFIRDGTISQGTVLEHGILGVHYALDWDGYGGLKQMISSFGEEYSPYPTEEMMGSKSSEWELGEDLPWREVEEAEEKLRMEEDKSNSSATNNEDMTDIISVANILASLDPQPSSDGNTQESISSPSVLIQNCESSEEGSQGYDDMDGHHKAQDNPLAHLAEVTLSKPPMSDSQFVEEDVLLIETRKDFTHWNFGL